MHIVLTIPGLAKASGGPSTVVQHLSEQLVSLGATVTVVTGKTTDRQSEALPRDKRVNLERVVANGKNGITSSFTGILRNTFRLNGESRKSAIVHDFGIWMPANHQVAAACQELGLPRVCSPCGMLAPWALQHRVWKKRLAWWLYQRRDLYRAAALVATASQEVEDIKRRADSRPIALIPNGVEIPEDSSEPVHPQSPRIRQVVFLGRIHPVKGLKNLVKAWSIVKPAGWRCILAGPDQGGYRGELDSLLRALNLQDQFEFTGLLDDPQKWQLLRNADLFVLPSYTENFGVAAAEALACGIPVITTKGTPWKDLIEHRSGWWIDTGVEALIPTLRQATCLADSERLQMGERGRTMVRKNYSWDSIGEQFYSLYAWLLTRGPKPNCLVGG